MAFTTTVGAGGTSLIGTSGVDTTTFAPGTLATSVFIGAQGDTDFITLQANQANSYTIRGGAGNDTITAAGFRNSLVTGDDGVDTITSTGTIQSATVSGLEGNDVITIANINAGLVNGNNGNDTMNLGTAAAAALTNNARFVGGQGNDAITVGSATVVANAVTLTSGLVNGQDGDDTITLANIAANMTFGGGSTIYGGQGSDNISAAGGSGNNVIISGDLGADNLTGDIGNDTIFGGEGNDRITGGTGDDSMVGGAGTDTFVQAGAVSSATAAGGVNSGVAYTFGTSANAVDGITDFTAGLNGDILSAGGAGAIAPTVLASTFDFATTNLVAGTVYAVSGNYSNGVFTIAAGNTGSDTLIYTAAAAASFDTNIAVIGNQLILSGVNVTQLTASNFS